MIDYKFTSIEEGDADATLIGTIWQGDITTENELQHNKGDGWSLQPVTRYRRTKLLQTYSQGTPKAQFTDYQTVLDAKLAQVATAVGDTPISVETTILLI